MKTKNKFIAFLLILISFISFFTIKNFIEQKNKKINSYITLNLMLDKLFNPKLNTDQASIEQIREKLNRDSSKLSKSSIPFSNIKNTYVPTDSEKIPIRIYTPEDASNLPLIIYSHGGFWIAGNLDTHDNICRKLSKNTKAVVISVDYSLAPEKPFPAGLNDVYNVLQWTYQNAESIHVDKRLIAIAGDSAGANLTSAVSLISQNKNGPKITCQVLIYPSTNIYDLNSGSWSKFANYFNISTEDMEKYISIYIPKKEDRKTPYASPLLADNFNGLPDTLVITAEIDPLRDEGEAYANKLSNSGIQAKILRIDGVTHGFITMDRIISKSDEALNEISSYLKLEFSK
ncbi:alpha/beta hydrolase [Clostridium sp. C2-6-12]|uniref:alpha/beta hydrolase n=1 Tax=Clostridium sp. C2-6-12 TaxID=2698832 RepID=UPI0019211487|nr:alpha/beta hydrolase [Clostridium sp. C2-6-12]